MTSSPGWYCEKSTTTSNRSAGAITKRLVLDRFVEQPAVAADLHELRGTFVESEFVPAGVAALRMRKRYRTASTSSTGQGAPFTSVTSATTPSMYADSTPGPSFAAG